ncbi:ferrous iron transport protein B [Christensenellaceae bacterium OttesenSCG-928-K19]|nr:ferrous iron transport protein B [Christensenellaceae bacterium OttesenSCG-928-K19]
MEKQIRIALAGNPNSGKTTMFNELTGSYQHVGNWPGVTVEKKEGSLKGHRKEVKVMDLPGIYSLSPYTLEEVISRNYLLEERPDVIIDIVDASNLERNLYLTLQLLETGIPVVVALNMMDVVINRGDKINAKKLAEELGCPVVETSAMRGKGIENLVNTVLEVAAKDNVQQKSQPFGGDVESAVKKIEKVIDGMVPAESLRWYAVKLFERDEKLDIKPDAGQMQQVESIVAECEELQDDESESIITSERYAYITSIIKPVYTKKNREKYTISDKIDRIVTNKWLALPIFFGIMWIVYYVSITTVGDWTIGWVEMFFEWLGESAAAGMEAASASPWAVSLVVDGIIGGIGSIIVFVPQLMILFLFLSILEDSGYMARVAFIMDRIFRRFGLSGKSFIPMLIGTGCSVPGIMASRTIENERDRRMTVMLTPFIPCGAKVPIIAMFAALLFPSASWVGPSMYIIGILVVIVSGVFLKRTKAFKGDPAPFVMELPEYKAPRAKGVLIHMWEKGRSFIIRAGTIIFVACAAIWFLQSFTPGMEFVGLEGIDQSILAHIGNGIRYIFIPLGFGDSWVGPVSALTGLVAKEVVVATLTMASEATVVMFSQVTAFAFMIFTLLSAPCFAAIGAMRREFGNAKWTWIAVLYQTGLAYVLAMLVNLIGGAVLAGTPATAMQTLDSGILEEASESDLVAGGDISLWILGILLVVIIVGVIISSVRNKKKYNDIGKLGA